MPRLCARSHKYQSSSTMTLVRFHDPYPHQIVLNPLPWQHNKKPHWTSIRSYRRFNGIVSLVLLAVQRIQWSCQPLRRTHEANWMACSNKGISATPLILVMEHGQYETREAGFPYQASSRLRSLLHSDQMQRINKTLEAAIYRYTFLYRIIDTHMHGSCIATWNFCQWLQLEKTLAFCILKLLLMIFSLCSHKSRSVKHMSQINTYEWHELKSHVAFNTSWFMCASGHEYDHFMKLQTPLTSILWWDGGVLGHISYIYS